MTPADGVEPPPPQKLPPCRRHHVSVIATTSLGPQGPSCLLPVPPPFLCTRPPPARGKWSFAPQVPYHASPSTSCLHLRLLLLQQPSAAFYTETATLRLFFFSTRYRHLDMTEPVHQMCGFGVLQPSERVVENFECKYTFQEFMC